MCILKGITSQGIETGARKYFVLHVKYPYFWVDIYGTQTMCIKCALL